jgi:hypothetical protein
MKASTGFGASESEGRWDVGIAGAWTGWKDHGSSGSAERRAEPNANHALAIHTIQVGVIPERLEIMNDLD